MCEDLFHSRASAESVAQQLTCIAAYFNFEGWLINIENDLSQSCLANVTHFLRSGGSKPPAHGQKGKPCWEFAPSKAHLEPHRCHIADASLHCTSSDVQILDAIESKFCAGIEL